MFVFWMDLNIPNSIVNHSLYLFLISPVAPKKIFLISRLFEKFKIRNYKMNPGAEAASNC